MPKPELINDTVVQSRPTKPKIPSFQNGRNYLQDLKPNAIYPLPIDLTETHRQTMTTLLNLQVFGAPLLSPKLLSQPPKRVLEIGCDTGFWSSKCHEYYSKQGHQVSFVGIDVKPLHESSNIEANIGMDWTYIEHDVADAPLPIPDQSFDLVMSRNMALALAEPSYQVVLSEYLRILKPGGTLEVWEHDYTVRTFGFQRQHDTADEELRANGAYSVDMTSTLGPAVNPYIIEYNKWIMEALGNLKVTAVPCSIVAAATLGAFLASGTSTLEDMISRRVAIPLGKTAWEREGGEPRVLTSDQLAIRNAALDNFISLVDALQPLLQVVSGKGEEDWNSWIDKAKKNWMEYQDFAFGECLEFGAWSFTNKSG